MARSVEPFAGSMPWNRSSKSKCEVAILPDSSAGKACAEARNPGTSPFKFSSGTFRGMVAVLCAVLAPGDLTILAQSAQQPAAAEAPAKIPNDQLDSLVAPIALYPDPLLSQTLVASTYPLEIVQLQQWLEKNKNLKDKALADAVKKQGWDPSIQAMAALPDVVKRLADDIKWTTDLGNAFLAQQSDVMDAVQRMRTKAQDTGNLKSNEQQKVETKVVESKQVIVIEQANPQVVYVPSYNPTVVYGPPVYPYPPIYYPPWGYYAAGMAISFGVGVAMGAFWSGGWGWGCGWGGNDIDINRNNNFNRNTNISNSGNRVNPQGNRAGNNKWQHNPQHRGGTPYADRGTANKYGGTARGDSMASRQANARQRQSQAGSRPQAGTMDRGGGGRAQAGSMDRSAGGRTSSNRGGGGGDRIGNRSVSGGSGSSRSSNAFSGASSGMGGGASRASSSRGSSSFGGSRGGGGFRGGGGRRR
jgi:Protein of unknown function (DUF3300)